MVSRGREERVKCGGYDRVLQCHVKCGGYERERERRGREEVNVEREGSGV